MPTARIDEIDKLRKKRSRKAFLKRLVIFLLIVVLIFSLFVGMRYASDYDIGGFITDFINSAGSGPGFPLDFAGNTALRLYPAKNAVALMTDTSFYLYKSDAKELLHTYFNYANPILVSSGNKFLIYDCFGHNYRMESMSNTLLDISSEEKIICADLAHTGHYAVLTESARSLATVSVYDKNNVEIFSWSSTENYLTACSLSPDGKTLALSGLMTSGGMLRSVIISFNVSNGEENFRKYYDNTLIYDISVISKSRISAVMENNAVVISSNGTAEQSFDYTGRSLIGYHRSEDDSLVLIFPEDNSNNENIVTLIDNDCFEIFTLRNISEITDLYIASQGIYLLNNNIISFYNNDGLLTKTASYTSDILYFTIMNTAAYAVTDSSIISLEFEPVPQS